LVARPGGRDFGNMQDQSTYYPPVWRVKDGAPVS